MRFGVYQGEGDRSLHVSWLSLPASVAAPPKWSAETHLTSLPPNSFLLQDPKSRNAALTQIQRDYLERRTLSHVPAPQPAKIRGRSHTRKAPFRSQGPAGCREDRVEGGPRNLPVPPPPTPNPPAPAAENKRPSLSTTCFPRLSMRTRQGQAAWARVAT